MKESTTSTNTSGINTSGVKKPSSKTGATMKQTWRIGLALSLLVLATGCSTMRAPSANDPLEGFNRGISGFNEVLDQVALKPLAKGYEAITAPEVRTCVNNFFSNLDDLTVAFNNLLQGKPKAAGSDLCRFALNSTLGIFGLADVASELGFQKHDEDFGQTLGVWGAKSGAYLVLPLLGPSTVRDIFGKVVDMPLDPTRYNDDVSERNALLALKATHKRAMLLPATDLIDRVALDKYAFVRDAYLARRESLIRDGAAENKDPLELDDEDDKPIEQQPTSGQTPSTTTPTSLLGKPEPSVLIPNQAPSATMASSGQTTTLGVAFAANLKPSDRTQQLLGWPVLVK